VHGTKRTVLVWLSNSAAILVADWFVGGIFFDDRWWVLAAGAVFGIVNWLVKPVVTLLALPLIILTVGVALFFVNLLMLYLASWVISDFHIHGFWSAVAGTIIVWAVNVVLHSAFGLSDRDH
jgi:putative membrane protein